MTTTILFIALFPLSIVILANALIVPEHNQTMKASRFIAGSGFLGFSVYCGLRSTAWIESSVFIVVGTLFLVAIGLYSVFGAPLLLEIVKRRER